MQLLIVLEFYQSSRCKRQGSSKCSLGECFCSQSRQNNDSISDLQDKCHLTERILKFVQQCLCLAKSSIIDFSKHSRRQRKILATAGSKAVAEVSFNPSIISFNSQNNIYIHGMKPVTESFYV